MKNSDRALNQLSQHLDKILFAVGFVYLVSISWWLTSQNRLVWPGSNRPQLTTTEAKAPLSSEDAKFIAHLQQSLKTLNQTNSSPPSTVPNPTTTPSTGQVNNVVPLTIPASQVPPPPPVAAPPKVVERIYVPVYPPQTAQPIQQAAVSPATLPVPPKPVLPRPPKAPITSPSVSQQSVPPTQPPAAVAKPKPAIAPMVVSKNPHTLVGVLEFGEQSSALFTANGLTQRFEIGERIGPTDWVLTKVENQKAILSRQGKTRYLEVGQSF